MRKQCGFTLIQVMVTITLMGVISMMASPLSGAIMADARVTETEGALNKAIGKAKALALRNAFGATGDSAAVGVCKTGGNELLVLQSVAGVPANCNTMAGEVAWRVQVNAQVTVKVNTPGGYADFSCICFSNKGLITGGSCSDNSCAMSTVFEVNSGNTTEVISLL